MWAMGDYGAVAERLASAGETAVEAAAIGSEDDVLDVACGTGNATIPAAERGASVTGLDLTPELLEGARAAAAEAGVEIDWVEGDAEALPFEDESFDAVISVFGVMFAPDQRQAAAEIARALRPGGRMAVCSWTPEGAIGGFFRTVGSHMPAPPEGFQPPSLWGTEEHVRGLFANTGIEMEFERAAVEFRFASPEETMAEYETKFGPVVAAKAALEPEEKWDALREDMLVMYARINTSDGDDLAFLAEYLVAKGSKA
ncbi:MAG: methyltransferase domain-containing protein [Actinomycetota bacterium]|nr:methyltransferase domain-containing protein [Actinomycetota bacterium]